MKQTIWTEQGLAIVFIVITASISVGPFMEGNCLQLRVDYFWH
jgi:hypothetical protein